jgi:heterogeneous nuclear rnp K-like protein 2
LTGCHSLSIGKGGSKIKEIQEASGARLNASEQMLPGSTEVSRLKLSTLAVQHTEPRNQYLSQRILSVSGVADAVHIAVYYIGTILLEYQERVGSNSGTSGTYRQTGGPSSSAGVGAPRQPAVIAPGPGAAVQQFWIPDDLVGSSEFACVRRL